MSDSSTLALKVGFAGRCPLRGLSAAMHRHLAAPCRVNAQCIVIFLPISLGVDGTDWGAQFDGMGPSDWYIQCLEGQALRCALQGRRVACLPAWCHAPLPLLAAIPSHSWLASLDQRCPIYVHACRAALMLASSVGVLGMIILSQVRCQHPAFDALQAATSASAEEALCPEATERLPFRLPPQLITYNLGGQILAMFFSMRFIFSIILSRVLLGNTIIRTGVQVGLAALLATCRWFGLGQCPRSAYACQTGCSCDLRRAQQQPSGTSRRSQEWCWWRCQSPSTWACNGWQRGRWRRRQMRKRLIRRCQGQRLLQSIGRPCLNAGPQPCPARAA